MKFIKLIIFLIVPFLTHPSLYSETEFSTVEVKVINIKSHSGKPIIVAVYNKSGFPKDGKQLQFKTVAANSVSENVNFRLSKGKYAFAVFHDLNNNGKLDKSMLGIPKEPYGLSNNVKPVYKEPSFQECEVIINGVSGKVEIALIH